MSDEYDDDFEELDVPMGGLKDCGCGPGEREVRDLSGLGDVNSDWQERKHIRARPPEWEPPTRSRFNEPRREWAPPKRPKPRKPRSKGKGDFCVISHKGNTVHCYREESVAERVATRFGERSGTRFTVKKRS